MQRYMTMNEEATIIICDYCNGVGYIDFRIKNLNDKWGRYPCDNCASKGRMLKVVTTEFRQLPDDTDQPGQEDKSNG